MGSSYFCRGRRQSDLRGRDRGGESPGRALWPVPREPRVPRVRLSGLPGASVGLLWDVEAVIAPSAETSGFRRSCSQSKASGYRVSSGVPTRWGKVSLAASGHGVLVPGIWRGQNWDSPHFLQPSQTTEWGHLVHLPGSLASTCHLHCDSIEVILFLQAANSMALKRWGRSNNICLERML